MMQFSNITQYNRTIMVIINDKMNAKINVQW